MSEADAQRLLDDSVLIGDKRFATAGGIAFVGQITHPGDADIWHGYPEAWDMIPQDLKKRWKDAGLVTARDLRRWKSRDDVGRAWKGVSFEDE